jgi:hypothetical protein
MQIRCPFYFCALHVMHHIDPIGQLFAATRQRESSVDPARNCWTHKSCRSPFLLLVDKKSSSLRSMGDTWSSARTDRNCQA